MSNVSVTNETIAARRLFPSDTLILMGVRKPSVSSTYAAPDPAKVAPDIPRPSTEPQGNAQRPNRKLLHPVKQGGGRLIVCARRAKKHAGRAGHVMRAFFCLSPGNLRRLGDAVVQKAVRKTGVCSENRAPKDVQAIAVLHCSTQHLSGHSVVQLLDGTPHRAFDSWFGQPTTHFYCDLYVSESYP